MSLPIYQNTKMEFNSDKKDYYEIMFFLPKKISKEIIILEKENLITLTESGYGYKTSIDFSIVTKDINKYTILNQWLKSIYSPEDGLFYHKSDIAGRVEMRRIDKTGLVLNTIFFEGVMINNLVAKEDSFQMDFIADYYYEEGSQSSLLSTKKTVSPVIEPMKSVEGYHITNIEKGVLGEISKIEEELNELKDAEKQGSKIMMMVELSDLYGALEEYCVKQGLTIEDLKIFSNITKRAFKNGRR